MRPYADTNFFTRFYLELPEKRNAVIFVNQASAAGASLLPVTWLHRLELINALQLHVFMSRQPGQTRITPEQAAVALAIFREQLQEAHFLRQVTLNTDLLEQQFDTLSFRHTARHGFRTYDVLHVASALVLNCDTFWSFDPKANKLAALEGLEILPAKIGT